MAHLTLQGIAKRYSPAIPVLTDIDLQVEEGAIVSLLGPSGCGKTTLLRVIAGLEQPDQGRVLFDGQDLNRVPVYRRRFGFMFQEFMLFPHLSVGENVGFGLRMAGQTGPQIRLRVEQMLALVDLQGYAHRRVTELSGGEQQRVALARSLAPNPRLLMLDEPLGSLDRTLREDLMNELRAIIKRVGVTSLYVTHDQQEAFAVADRLAVMNQGRIEQIGSPEQVYRLPASPFVARFLGMRNLLPAAVDAAEPQQAQTPLGPLTLSQPAAPGAYTLLIRPEAAGLCLDDDSPHPQVTGTLLARSFRGSRYQLQLTAGEPDPIQLDFELHVAGTVQGRAQAGVTKLLTVGQPLRLTLDPELLLLLPPDPQRLSS